MRTSLTVSGLILSTALLLAACGESEPEIACCAIEPKAKCEGDMLGAGLTRSEVELLLGPAEWICPSGTLSEARIRETLFNLLSDALDARAAGNQRICLLALGTLLGQGE